MSNKRSGGFTIVELLIAMALMGILVPSISIGLTNLTVINNRARSLVLANMIAQNKIETLRSIGYNSIALGTTTFTSELPSTLGGTKSADYTVTSPQTGLKQVDVNISFNDYTSTRSVTFRTYVSELGVGQ